MSFSLLHCSKTLIPDGAPVLKHVSVKKRDVSERSTRRTGRRSSVYILAVSGHTFITAVLSVPVVAVHGGIVAAGSHAHEPRCGRFAGRLHLHVLNQTRGSSSETPHEALRSNILLETFGTAHLI